MVYLSSRRLRPTPYGLIGSLMAISILWMNVGWAYAHGGKKHSDSDFTALQALQKAIAAYDKLIVAGKLEESWETGLRNVQVVTREKNGKREYRISFERTAGTPKAVYIFYSQDGEYAGSNFDGQ